MIVDESPPVPAKASTMLDIRSNTSPNIGNCNTATPTIVRPSKEPIILAIELTTLALRKLLKTKSNTAVSYTHLKEMNQTISIQFNSSLVISIIVIKRCHIALNQNAFIYPL